MDHKKNPYKCVLHNTFNLSQPLPTTDVLRSCLGLCKVNHLLQTISPDVAQRALTLFDKGLRHTLQVITYSSLNDKAWQRASHPIHFGSLGLWMTSSAAPAAFLGSRNSTHTHLLGECLNARVIPTDKINLTVVVGAQFLSI